MVYITYSNATFLSSALCILISSFLYILRVSFTIYRITLLSNHFIVYRRTFASFRDLQNYTTLKPTDIKLLRLWGFRDLQNYTTLKRRETAKS